MDLSGIPSTVTLGSMNTVNFTCTVNITCNGTCNSGNMLTITWFGNNTVIMSDSGDYTLSQTSHNVTLSGTGNANFTSTLSVDGAVSTTHAVQYKCRAELSGTSMNSTGTLTVQSE